MVLRFNMNIWLLFATYVLYRIFRFIFHFVQTQIVWRLNGTYARLSKINSDSCTSPHTCQLLSIIYKKNLVEGDMANGHNFIWWHDKFVDPNELLLPDPTWILYTIDDDFAYFLKMPKPWTFYHAREAPFVRTRQFADGTKLARMPLKAFCDFANKSLSNPKGPVVYYSNAARSGSTLLTRVMQV